MNKNNTDNEFINQFEDKLIEFERRIEEDDYDAFQDGFKEEFDNLKNEAQELYHECIDQDETKVVDNFMQRLDSIRDDQGLYNEEA